MAGLGYVVNSMTLKIGATQYETAVLSVEEVPNVPIQSATMINGDTLTDVGPVQWSLNIEANVDVAPASLWRILTAAVAGTTATYEFVPDVTTNPTVKRTGTVVLIPPGGKFKPGEFATFSVSLPIQGQPVTT